MIFIYIAIGIAAGIFLLALALGLCRAAAQELTDFHENQF